jgi:cysteine-rich repeat protein
MSKLARSLIALTAALGIAGVAAAQSAGPNLPGSIVDNASIGTQPWGSPSQATSSDDLYAFAAVGTGTPSHYLAASNFGFALPPTAVVLGIRADVERRAIGGIATDNAVRIIKGGVIGATDRSLGGSWPATDTVVSYGGASDLWGETWTAANINAAGFGVAISAKDSISGALAQVDAMSITVFYSLCGDGTLAGGEACDDSNTANGDCCDSTCQFEANGSSCADGDLCNGDETCDGSGNCDSGAPLDCEDGDVCSQDTCSPTLGCQNSNQPRTGCKTALKSVLIYKDNASDTKDKLVWKWIKGQPTSFAQLGVPTGTATAYTLCLYAYAGTTAAQIADVDVPGGTGWSVVGSNSGYKYKNSTGAEDGVRKIILKTSNANKSKALLKAKGANLPDITTPISLPVTAQLVNSSTSTCFTADYTTAKKNVAGTFKAKSP